jgi:hypothetical protein
MQMRGPWTSFTFLSAIVFASFAFLYLATMSVMMIVTVIEQSEKRRSALKTVQKEVFTIAPLQAIK